MHATLSYVRKESEKPNNHMHMLTLQASVLRLTFTNIKRYSLEIESVEE
jgi:hypothetical protein